MPKEEKKDDAADVKPAADIQNSPTTQSERHNRTAEDMARAHEKEDEQIADARKAEEKANKADGSKEEGA
jgi:hypothetical protein